MKIEEYISQAKRLKDKAYPFSEDDILSILEKTDELKLKTRKKIVWSITAMTLIILFMLGRFLLSPSEPTTAQSNSNIEPKIVQTLDGKVESAPAQSKSKSKKKEKTSEVYFSIIDEKTNPNRIISNPNRRLRESNSTTISASAAKIKKRSN